MMVAVLYFFALVGDDSVRPIPEQGFQPVHISTVSGPCTAERVSSTTLVTSSLLGDDEPSRK